MRGRDASTYFIWDVVYFEEEQGAFVSSLYVHIFRSRPTMQGRRRAQPKFNHDSSNRSVMLMEE